MKGEKIVIFFREKVDILNYEMRSTIPAIVENRYIVFEIAGIVSMIGLGEKKINSFWRR